MSNPSIYFLFIDGIGLAPKNGSNPFSELELPGFTALAESPSWTSDLLVQSTTPSLLIRGIDANLGIDGLPQSGTGQSTIFSGVNCAQLAGRHYGPYPHSTSRDVLLEKNIFRRVGPGRSVFANAYPERFFRYAERRDRWPTTTRCCLDSGIKIRTISDLEEGNALAADITGAGLAAVSKANVTTISESAAAKRVRSMCSSNALVVSEYFHTDKAGHAQDPIAATSCLRSLDRFISCLLDELDWSQTTMVLTSDHGNMEDLSVKTHTRNPVPLVVRGPSAHYFSEVSDLSQLADAVELAVRL